MERKYKIGDRVRIVNKRVPGMSQQGNMDKYLGTVMTIKRYIFDRSYEMIEDDSQWAWDDNTIQELAEQESDQVSLREGLILISEICNSQTSCSECPLKKLPCHTRCLNEDDIPEIVHVVEDFRQSKNSLVMIATLEEGDAFLCEGEKWIVVAVREGNFICARKCELEKGYGTFYCFYPEAKVARA